MPLSAAGFKAGVSRQRITPPLPFWLTGYAARTNPATRVNSELWAKGLALQDPDGGRLVVVTTDLIGLPREISEAVATAAGRRHGLQRSQLVLNSSHTHCGPVVWPNLRVMFGLNAEDRQRAEAYGRSLVQMLGTVVDQALADLAPATLGAGHGQTGFAMNRREPTARGVRLGENPNGPVDHDVPVLRVVGPDGRLRAVLFGYACHNTTLGGDIYLVDGDYAGAAQRALEDAHPGATALFLMLCGGDQNPRPRGTLALAQEHGRRLAEAVEATLQGSLRAVRPPIRTAWERVDLDFAPHTRDQFVAEAQDRSVFRQRRAQLMLEAYDQDRPVRRLSYPVQAARLNEDLTLLALGGEVVVDFALRAKRTWSAENLIVAGYCNDVACYIPSRRVLGEGGYEPVDSMIYYAQPGPFADTVEDRIFETIGRVLAAVGVPPPR